MANLEPVLTDDTTRRNFSKLEILFDQIRALITSVFGGSGGGTGTGTGPAQARVYNSAAIATTSGAVPALTFNSERYDTGGFHSTSVNTERLTAPTAGLYSIGATVRWEANAAGARQTFLRVNGTTIIDLDDRDIDAATNHTNKVNTEYQLAAGDYVEVLVFQNSGGPLNVLATGNYTPEFWIHRIGSQA
jgi:hypothetical protein